MNFNNHHYIQCYKNDNSFPCSCRPCKMQIDGKVCSKGCLYIHKGQSGKYICAHEQDVTNRSPYSRLDLEKKFHFQTLLNETLRQNCAMERDQCIAFQEKCGTLSYELNNLQQIQHGFRQMITDLHQEIITLQQYRDENQKLRDEIARLTIAHSQVNCLNQESEKDRQVRTNVLMRGRGRGGRGF